MKLHDIRVEIAKLPDGDIPSLLEWLRNYYDGPVWDRQIDSEGARLGPARFLSLLGCERPGGE